MSGLSEINAAHVVIRPSIATLYIVSVALALIASGGCSSDSDERRGEDTPVIDVGVDLGMDTGTPPTDTGGDAGDGDSGGGDADADAFVDSEMPYRYLSTYGLFEDAVAQRPAEGVLPYGVNGVLYADDSEKLRFLSLPEGGQITFDAMGRWVFPEGSIAIKTFYYDLDARDPSQGRRLLETRLLIREAEEWSVHTYVWNEGQTEAERLVVGLNLTLDRIDETGASVTTEYLVPNNNQCKNCHEQSRLTLLLGPNTRQMNRMNDYGAGPVNQIDHMVSLSWFDGPVPMSSELEAMVDFTDEGLPIVDRARSYLDANCSHCHNAAGSASSSGLNLGFHVDRDTELGVCRRPFAAGPGSGGLSYDIVPGDPASSIMVFRMSSTDPSVKMPELPTRTVDDLGRDIISEWIGAMTPDDCQ